jgi:hypothetical protein
MSTKINHESSEPLAGCLGVVRCTAKAVCISRMAKSDCAGEWGGCGRLSVSVDGPGHYNPDRSEGHWGRTKVRMTASRADSLPGSELEYRSQVSDGAKSRCKPGCRWEGAA